MPDPTQIMSIEEPWIRATIITPDQYLGGIIKICQDTPHGKIRYRNKILK